MAMSSFKMVFMNPCTIADLNLLKFPPNLKQIFNFQSQNVTLGDAVRLSCGIRVSLANVGRQLEDFLRRRFPSVRELQRGQLVIDIIRNSYGMPQLRTPVRELYGELRATVGSVLVS